MRRLGGVNAPSAGDFNSKGVTAEKEVACEQDETTRLRSPGTLSAGATLRNRLRERVARPRQSSSPARATLIWRRQAGLELDFLVALACPLIAYPPAFPHRRISAQASLSTTTYCWPCTFKRPPQKRPGRPRFWPNTFHSPEGYEQGLLITKVDLLNRKSRRIQETVNVKNQALTMAPFPEVVFLPVIDLK